MTVQNYLLFCVASIVLCLVPGPDMVFLLSRSIAQGRKAGVLAALGINLGGYVHLTAAVLGLSAVLAASAFAFTVVKWAGAAYLIYLGVIAWRSKTGPLALEAGSTLDARYRTIFRQGFLSDVLNPKVAMFFLALLPQFVHAEGHSPTSQLLLLGVTVNVIALTINIGLVQVSSAVTSVLRENTNVAAWLGKAMGAVFIGLGLRIATEKV